MDTMIIGIAGGTGSGKTTLTEKLKAEFGEDVCTGTGYLRNAGKGGMERESVGKPAISKGLGAVWAGIRAAAYHLS